MMFKTIIFGGFLFATACAVGTINIATLEVKPNFDQGLTYKDFRVQFAGVQEASGEVKIKISKQSDSSIVHEFKVDHPTTPKAYYFGLNHVEEGKYEVQVCDGSTCSPKNAALTSLLPKSDIKKVSCVRGSYDSSKRWTNAAKDAVFELEVIGAGDWLQQSDIEPIETPLKPYKTEWSQFTISKNPSYDNNKKLLYAAVFYNVTHYRELFLKKGTIGGDQDDRQIYTHDFCKRKYLLSSHVHLVDTNTKEVKYRFKKTLYLSSQGKKYFIYDNEGEKGKKVPIEMTFENETIDPASYDVWVSFCATEKDVVDSTVCSDPVIHSEKLTVTSPSE